MRKEQEKKEVGKRQEGQIGREEWRERKNIQKEGLGLKVAMISEQC